MYASYAYLVPIVLVVLLLFAAIRILPEYKRGVVFFLGRFQAVKGPGLLLLIPAIQKMQVVDLRTVTLDVPEQDVISQDNVTVRVNAVLYFRVVDPEKAIIQVENFGIATSQLAQTTLRSVLGKHDLDEMLSERDRLNNDIQEILDTQTEAWGIKVANVEIKHVDLDESMIRAIARQAEAERERRAKVIHAEGELQASHKLVEAADVMSSNSAALQLRYLQTLSDMSNKNASTIVFPLPMDIMDAFKHQMNKAGTAPTSSDASDGEASDTPSSRFSSGPATPDNEA
ncbi:slipin family protein [Chromohalobacter nigrandesensis]|uniref:slipin family protein n=1 Tax=Chromohalobacter nigrandesensis TaxID=119863 RepID=UPI001FF0FA96|nr:slipin family protein [Chromohalobacter nigrandesensis]MCK0746075.1 slipin family protein [Chromohalobacter nigrandesensis]